MMLMMKLYYDCTWTQLKYLVIYKIEFISPIEMWPINKLLLKNKDNITE